MSNLLKFMRMLPRPVKRVLRPLQARIEIRGKACDVLLDVAKFRPQKSQSLVFLNIKAKSAEGAWLEDYELPVINGANTTTTKKVLEGLLKQARISKEQYEEALDDLSRTTRKRRELFPNYWQ